MKQMTDSFLCNDVGSGPSFTCLIHCRHDEHAAKIFKSLPSGSPALAALCKTIERTASEGIEIPDALLWRCIPLDVGASVLPITVGSMAGRRSPCVSLGVSLCCCQAISATAPWFIDGEWLDAGAVQLHRAFLRFYIRNIVPMSPLGAELLREAWPWISYTQTLAPEQAGAVQMHSLAASALSLRGATIGDSLLVTVSELGSL